MNCKKGLWSVHHEPASILPDSDDVSGLGRQSEIKFSINNVHAAFTALEGPTCTALIKMTGKYKQDNPAQQHDVMRINQVHEILVM